MDVIAAIISAQRHYSVYEGESLPNETVTRPLGGETKRENHKTMAVTRGPPQFIPVIAVKFLLESQGLANLRVLLLHNFILVIASRVNIGQDAKRFFILSLRDKPSRRPGNEPDEGKLQSRRENLDKGRSSPVGARQKKADPKIRA